MFAQKLKELRTEKNLTQKGLSEAIHVSRSAIAKWEQGRGFPTEESTADLCAFFNVSKANLIDDDQEIIDRYRTHQKRKKILWISLSIFVLLTLAGGITGGVFYQRLHNYQWPALHLKNTLQNRAILCKTGLTYTFSKSDIVPEDSSVSVSSIDLSGLNAYGSGAVKANSNSLTFSKPGFYPLVATVYDKTSKNAYSGVSLGKFYVYDPEALTPIASLDDFKAIAKNPSGAYYLSANIDAKNVSDFSAVCNGANDTAFSGVFLNPSHYWISGLKIAPSSYPSEPTSYRSSLLGSVKNAYVDHLILKDYSIDISAIASASSSGAIADHAENSYFGDCLVEGSLVGRGLVGGLLGYAQTSILKNCSFNESLKGEAASNPLPASYNHGIGGMVGYVADLDSSDNFHSVYDEVNVSADITGDDNVGGILGTLETYQSKNIDTLFEKSVYSGNITCTGAHQGQHYGQLIVRQ
jgi:Predicted transcriptional regulators